MDAVKFLEVFAKQFENTEPSTIKLKTKFKDIPEWDSLMALTIIAMADEEYDAKLTGQEIRESITVQDLFKKIKAKM